MTLAAALVIAVTALDAAAQTPYVPYYGKNKIRYDNFPWHIYTTDHFEIYYYPDIKQHLERITSYAESAYQQVSADLKHDLAFKVPLVIYKTQAEFQQQNIEPSELPEGVLAFAEPYRDRMVLPIDEPSDALYRLITHELTHIFEFDIIPRSLLRRGLPLWVDEGLSDHMTGYWNPFDLMTVRDAAISDTIPPMSDFQGQAFVDGRLPYNLGHAAFEFIESRWGKEGLRQFLFALRKNVIGGGESAYEEAFRLKAEEFDEQFEKYLKDRFKPFRDKERPADYGKDLAPKREKTPYVAVVSIEPSPSGDLMAVAAGNRKDQELDIILMSTKDGKVIRNLTGGFNKDKGFEYIVTPGGFRNNAVPWMSWAPAGDRLAYFARTEKQKTMILQNVVNRKIERRIELKTVDMPESPDISPDGKEVAFAALSSAIGDIFVVNIETGAVRNVTNDQFGDYSPTWTPDGKGIVYLARVSGNDKLFRLDLATGTKTQLTFGTHDDGGAQFVDNDTIVFPSTALDPNTPVDPEVARNGNIFNLWTLSLKSGELRQYTDTLTANTSPVVLRGDTPQKLAFVTYYKGEYGIHTLNRDKPLHVVASADFGAPGPIIDFQPPLNHTLVAQNSRKKGTFEKLFLEGRPPVNVGVTSGGDLFGGTQVTFTDVLGDKQFNMYAASVSQYRTMSFSYTNLSRRFQYALQAYSQTQFYYGYDPGLLYGYESRLHRPRRCPGNADVAWRHGLRHLSTQSLRAARAVHRLPAVPSRNTTNRFCSRSPTIFRTSSMGARCFPAVSSCRSASPSFRKRRSSASTDRSRAIRFALGTSTRRAGATCCHVRPQMLMRVTTCDWERTACWPSARAGTRAGASSRATSTSVATRNCAAMTTSSSWGTRRFSPMPNCGSR